MFGSGNEPTTVEEFERLFPESYYAYDEGSLLSFNPTDIQTTGFNQYDNSKQTGNVHVLADNKYRIKGTYTGLTYSDGSDVTITSDEYFTPDRVDYLTLSGGNDVDTCVHLSWSGYRDGDSDYEKYWSVNTDLTWIRTLEHNGEVLFPNGLCKAGDVYDEIGDGKAIKRVGSVDLGTLNWTYTNDGRGFLGQGLNNYVSLRVGIRYICQKYISKEIEYDSEIRNMGDKTVGIKSNGNIFIQDSSYTDATTFKTAMQGVMLYYELAEPITVTFPTQKDLGYNVQSGGTEQLLPTNPAGTGPITAPIIESVNYPLDAVGTLTNLPKNYISVESMDSFTTALGNTLNLNITKTWDSTDNKWTFSVTSRS